MADIYLLNCKKLKQQITSLSQQISPERRQKALKMKKNSAALNLLGAELCLCYALSLCLPLSPKKDGNGKPFIEGEKQFNISHSGDYVVCVVSPNAVGVDIEEISRMSGKVFDRICSPKERQMALSIEIDRLEKYFCRVWTRKESILKLSGIGIRQKLSEVCTESSSLFLSSLEIDSSYMLSVCLEKQETLTTHFITAENIKQYFNI